MDDNFVEHIRVGVSHTVCSSTSLLLSSILLLKYPRVRNLYFFGMDGILYLERKLTVGVRDCAGRTARNRNIDIFQALFALFYLFTIPLTVMYPLRQPNPFEPVKA